MRERGLIYYSDVLLVVRGLGDAKYCKNPDEKSRRTRDVGRRNLQRFRHECHILYH